MSSVKRLIMAIGGALLLLSAVCNLAFVWRNVNLHRELLASQVKLQQLNQTQQLIPAIAQDLVNLSQQQQFSWLGPILQRYLHPQAAPAAAPASATAPKKNP